MKDISLQITNRISDMRECTAVGKIAYNLYFNENDEMDILYARFIVSLVKEDMAKI